MKVLELFCGLGGWSKPWIEQGHDVTGIDYTKQPKYPGRFIQADLFDWEPDQHYDVILASPPCIEFSVLKSVNHGNVDERQGLDLVYRTFYLIEKIKPKYWLIENVRGLGKFLPKPKDIVSYGPTKSHKQAWLWGNFPNLPMFENEIYHRHMDYSGGDPRRSLIPYPLANALMKTCSNDIMEKQ